MVKGSNFDKAKIGGPIKHRRIVRFVALETRTRPSSLDRYTELSIGWPSPDSVGRIIGKPMYYMVLLG